MSTLATYPWLVWLLLVVPAGLDPASQEQRYRERQVLDPQRQEWLDQEPPPDASPTNALDQARALLAAGEPKDARELLEDWLDEVPDDDRYYEALYLLGETWFESENYWKAVVQFQTVGENAAGELFHKANERCVDVARAFLAGEKRILWGIFRIPAYDDGIEILDRVWQREPGSRLGELALKLKADFYFERGEMDLAQDEYANLVAQYPSGRYVQLAMLRTAESAEAAFPGIKFTARPLLEAEERYRQLANTFPAYAERENVDQRLDGIRQQRASKDLDIAAWYERTRRADAAIFYYREILSDWPETLAAEQARARLQALGAAPVSGDFNEGGVE